MWPWALIRNSLSIAIVTGELAYLWQRKDQPAARRTCSKVPSAICVMAQHKYDLTTVKTQKDGPKKHFPWYRERLNLKFLKSHSQAAIFDGVNWTFVPKGTDDFRTGVPGNTKSGLIRLPASTVPLIGSTASGTKKMQTSFGYRSDSGDATLFRKEGPQRQLRREYIKAVELGLLRHPIAIYPHLVEAIPGGMADDIVQILDPALVKETEPADSADKEQSQPLENQEDAASAHSLKADVEDENNQGLIYKFPLKKTAKEREEEEHQLLSEQVISATQQSRVNEVTRDLVQWGEQLGSSEDKVNEHTIRNLFGSDYETKPISMAPVQVVELDAVPNELKVRTHSRTSQQSDKSRSLYHYYGYQHVGQKELELHDNIAGKRVVKTKYGAWYLPKKLWKLRQWDEPVADPKELEAKEAAKRDKKQQEWDNNLIETHGAKAFKEFILTYKSGVQMPEFLKSVDLTTSEWVNRKV